LGFGMIQHNPVEWAKQVPAKAGAKRAHHLVARRLA
jgi:hypothetical protein